MFKCIQCNCIICENCHTVGNNMKLFSDKAIFGYIGYASFYCSVKCFENLFNERMDQDKCNNTTQNINAIVNVLFYKEYDVIYRKYYRKHQKKLYYHCHIPTIKNALTRQLVDNVVGLVCEYYNYNYNYN